MIRVSSPKIKEFVEMIDGKEIEGVLYRLVGKIIGIQAIFETNAEDEEYAKDSLKVYLKQKYGYLKFYVEVI